MMLDLKLLEGSHTGANIALVTWEVLNSFDICHKIQSVTTDNASNMDTFFINFEKIAHEKVQHNYNITRILCNTI